MPTCVLRAISSFRKRWSETGTRSATNRSARNQAKQENEPFHANEMASRERERLEPKILRSLTLPAHQALLLFFRFRLLLQHDQCHAILGFKLRGAHLVGPRPTNF